MTKTLERGDYVQPDKKTIQNTPSGLGWGSQADAGGLHFFFFVADRTGFSPLANLYGRVNRHAHMRRYPLRVAFG